MTSPTFARTLRRNTSFFLLLYFLPLFNLTAQKASIQVRDQQIPTYMFSDPDPIPILSKRTDIYPYFRFDGYAHTKEERTWKVIELQNPYLQVGILPQVGGKIWGIKEKESGEDFIYWNEVLKFRDVAMRGAWTSGGIEFNFGFIGHTPATATPVDYMTRENPDGSVSCFIGGLDLAARTEWRVEMRLASDKAFLETKSFWMNPNPLHHAYYYWSNSAVRASQDLEFHYPGSHYIGHDGKLSTWPISSEGRDLSKYANNAFGSHKSYHILGHNENHQGVYWTEKGLGMGHWALQRDLPGQKLWLWALSRNGGIWEDLLTDENGQYVEVQAGRMFNQANLNSGLQSPFGQGVFYPYAANEWRELWFPLKGTKGLNAASEKAALSLVKTSDGYDLHLMGLEAQTGQLIVRRGKDTLLKKSLRLAPLATEVLSIEGEEAMPLHVQYGELTYQTPSLPIARPLASEPMGDEGPSAITYRAEQEFLFRNYEQSRILFEQVLALDPHNKQAWNRLAEIAYHRGAYQLGVDYVQRVLRVDSYEGLANFLLGTLLCAQGKDYAAHEAFALATKDPRYFVGASIQQAQLLIKAGKYEGAKRLLAQLTPGKNHAVEVLKLQLIAERKLGNEDAAQQLGEQLLDIDPLNHVIRFEAWKRKPSPENASAFQQMIRNELPQETYLELALYYYQMGCEVEAMDLLGLAPKHPTVLYWQYFLTKDPTYLELANSLSVEGVFPFRRESIPVLTQASRMSNSWKPAYYLGLLYWGLGKKEEAYARLRSCGDSPDFVPFFLTRALLAQELGKAYPTIEKDFEIALQRDPQQWRGYKWASSFWEEEGKFEKALACLEEGNKRFPDNYNLGLSYASLLLREGDYSACLDVLEDIQVLPFEGASAGHSIYEQAHVLRALEWMEKRKYKKALSHLTQAKEWPERLGVGKPYDPDERLIDYLMALCTEKDGKEAQTIWEKLTETGYPHDSWQFFSMAALLELERPEELQTWMDQLPGEQAEWIKAYLYRSSDVDMLLDQLGNGKARAPYSKDEFLVQVLRRMKE